MFIFCMGWSDCYCKCGKDSNGNIYIMYCLFFIVL